MRVCPECGAEFSPKGRQVFCDDHLRVLVTCYYCGVEFYRRRAKASVDRLFCSNSCKIKGRAVRYLLECRHCKREFESDSPRSQFCPEDAAIRVCCGECGSEFEIARSAYLRLDREIFCSRSCSSRATHKKYRDRDPEGYRERQLAASLAGVITNRALGNFTGIKVYLCETCEVVGKHTKGGHCFRSNRYTSTAKIIELSHTYVGNRHYALQPR